MISPLPKDDIKKEMKSDITRYDRNLAVNMPDFSNYGDDATLIKNLVVFFSKDVNHDILPEDLFGKKILDPKSFAEHMGYKNHRSLLKPHKTPEQKKTLKSIAEAKNESIDVSADTMWNTLLCNALYRLRYESLRFSKVGKTPDGLDTSELREIRFLKHAKKFQDPRSNKILYEIEYDDQFQNNLARYFFKIYTSVFAALRRNGLQDFYIFLTNLRDQANPNNGNPQQIHNEFSIDTISFDLLCRKAGVNSTRPSDNKVRINRAFNKINKLLGENLFLITWKKNGNFKFQPVITFKFSENELLENTQESSKRLMLFFGKNLKNFFRDKYFKTKKTTSNNFRFNYAEWLKSHDKDVVEKRSVYANTHIQCFAREVDIYSNKTNTEMNKICEQLAKQTLEGSTSSIPEMIL